MRFCLGLTGSIGMGKSTTAQMFVAEGCALWDADAAVHRLYDVGGAAVGPIGDQFPEAVKDGKVNRDVLRQIIGRNPDALKQIEGIVHPLVGEDRAIFRETATADILVFDIPLLFETGGDARVDAVAVVSVSEEVQQKRVLERGSMTRDQFLQIKAKQMPDADKRAKADFVIITDTRDHACQQVQDIVVQIRTRIANA